MALAPEWWLSSKRNSGSITPDRWLNLIQITQLSQNYHQCDLVYLLQIQKIRGSENTKNGQQFKNADHANASLLLQKY